MTDETTTTETEPVEAPAAGRRARRAAAEPVAAEPVSAEASASPTDRVRVYVAGGLHDRVVLPAGNVEGIDEEIEIDRDGIEVSSAVADAIIAAAPKRENGRALVHRRKLD